MDPTKKKGQDVASPGPEPIAMVEMGARRAGFPSVKQRGAVAGTGYGTQRDTLKKAQCVRPKMRTFVSDKPQALHACQGIADP